MRKKNASVEGVALDVTKGLSAPIIVMFVQIIRAGLMGRD